MVVVDKKKGESKDNLFKKFTKAFIEEDIINEVRKKMFYKKPSLVRKEEAREKARKKVLLKNNR